MFKKTIIYAASFVVLAFCVLIFRPVPIPSNISECHKVVGVVMKIGEGGTNDIKFRIKDEQTVFYINRGMEYGLTIAELEDKLVGKEVTLYYPDYWTPLDPYHSIKHLSQLEYQGEVLFTEISG